jgi:integrase
MEWPIAPGVKAPAWWRALLVTAYNTGIRRGALFKLRMTDIQWDDCALVVRAATAKTGIGQRIPLNKTVLGHLSAIRTNRELVFPLSFGSRHFDTVFHRLQKAAGIPRDEHFGLHDLRRTAATLMWEESPAAAQLMLGHTTSRTTRQFYVNNRSILARAVARIPQPAAFSATELNGGAA